MPSANFSLLRILEIGEVSRMRHAFKNTLFFSTFVGETKKNKQPETELVSATTLIPLVRHLSDPDFDLIVVHASPHGPIEALIRTVFRRSALRGHFPLFRTFAQQLLRGEINTPVAVLDLHDSPSILSCNQHLFEVGTKYFKRELPADRWRLFMHAGKVPTLRQRRSASYRDKLFRISPISLGIPDGMLRHEMQTPCANNKDIDVFFAGRLKWSSTVRERGVYELTQLAKAGLRVEIREDHLESSEYFAHCARAWLVWAPEGYGWDCFRPYEAALAGSVPVISRQTIERYQPFIDKKHCIYYDVEVGHLARKIQQAFSDRNRLITMARAARDHVLQHHTPHALAHYVAQTTLDEAGHVSSNSMCS